MNYRREIDGLRAVALLPVILYHAGFEQFSGGFIGVDVFFVISGFLITSIILTEKQAGTFSLVNFYERRARRILPALFFVMLACLPFSWFWMLPNQLNGFSESLVSVSLFISNIYFKKDTGYFAATAEEKPLLHTWSLAVEEQYYLIFPALVLLLWRFGRKWLLLVLSLLAASSLLFSELDSSNRTDEIFYDTRGRVWELLIGSFIVILNSEKIKFNNSANGRQTGSLIGLALIVYAIFAFDKSTPFPSSYTLIPTLGTAFVIIFATPQTIVGKMLGSKFLVGVGLISYSAYLWHQPLFAFARIRSLIEPSIWLFGLLTLFSFLLAYLTWRYIEKPFRAKIFLNRKTIFIGSFFISLTLISVGKIVEGKEGFPDRVLEPVIQATAGSFDNNPRLSDCRDREPNDACVYGAGSTPNVVLWGDSHADQLVPMISDVAERLKFSFLEYSFSGCPPIVNVENNDGIRRNCPKTNDMALRAIEENSSIKLVILHAYWQHYIDDKKVRPIKLGLRVDEQFYSTIQRLVGSGKKVLIISSVPRMPLNVPKYLQKVRWFGDDLDIHQLGIPLHSHKKHTSISGTLFKTTEEKYKDVSIFNPSEFLCGETGNCIAIKNDKILYRDDNHLSVVGGMLMKETFHDFLQAAWIDLF